MKYVPFAILSIMGLYSHLTGYPAGAWMSGLFAAIWGAFLFTEHSGRQTLKATQQYERRINGLNYVIDLHQKKINSLQSQFSVAKVKQAKILKSQDVLAGQITDIDRRVQGNDPFGG